MTAEAKSVEVVKVEQGYEIKAWKWMRYSGLLLIPLAWFHVALQDVLVGVHRIDLDYVALRWSMLSWRVYDFLLLAFAFAHGMNGLRQVLNDYIRGEHNRRRITWVLFAFWALISLIGAIPIIMGVRMP
jgi:succinate dehydrogenase / fumarate reductase, membrane anchor subunit